MHSLQLKIGKVGFTADFHGDWSTLFGEGPGQIMVTSREADVAALIKLFPPQHTRRLGVTTEENGLVLSQYNLKLKSSEIKTAYQEAT
jgi:hypothetical protein